MCVRADVIASNAAIFAAHTAQHMCDTEYLVWSGIF